MVDLSEALYVVGTLCPISASTFVSYLLPESVKELEVSRSCRCEGDFTTPRTVWLSEKVSKLALSIF
jgi:hypothetical protein